MRVIFLDIDGVMNSGPWLMRETPESVAAHKRTDLPHGADDIDRRAVDHLQRIVDESGACIVISSSWRHHHKTAGMKRLLGAHGLSAQVIGCTPCAEEMAHEGVKRTCRGDEIALWLSRHPEVEDFVILDDDEQMGALNWKLVRTDFERGLTSEDADRALAVLRGELMGEDR